MKNNIKIPLWNSWQEDENLNIAYIYNKKLNKFIILEDISKNIWRHITKGNTNIPDIVNKITLEYYIEDKIEVEKDVCEFIDNLLDLEIIKYE